MVFPAAIDRAILITDADREVRQVTHVLTAQKAQEAELKPKAARLYHVVLLDDDDHSYAYVIEMLGRVFGYDAKKAFRMACEVDASGRVVVDTTHLERAELKQHQIHSYGPDYRCDRCAGSMSAIIEPVEA